MQILMWLLLAMILLCGIAVSLAKDLKTTVVIFMCQSLAMCVIWIRLQSPDLAITEAAVGTGIDSLLLLVTLKKIHAIDRRKEAEKHEPRA